MCQQILSLILGSFRLLLFFGSLLMAVIGAFLALQINWARSIYTDLGALDWQQNLFWLNICAIYLVVITLAGSLGAFYNNKKLIQAFGLIIMINIIICIVVMVVLPNQKQTDVKFLSMLKDAQQDYDWRKEANSKSTQLWDKLQQEQHCCGLDAPQDWLPYSKNRTYPKSCCSNPINIGSDSYCQEPDAGRKGCLDAVFAPILIVIFTFVGAMVISVPLAVIACISSIKGYD